MQEQEAGREKEEEWQQLQRQSASTTIVLHTSAVMVIAMVIFSV